MKVLQYSSFSLILIVHYSGLNRFYYTVLLNTVVSKLVPQKLNFKFCHTLSVKRVLKTTLVLFSQQKLKCPSLSSDFTGSKSTL